MTRTLVLRLSTDTPGGRLRGVVEDVVTGAREPFTSDLHLASLLRRFVDLGRDGPRPDRDDPPQVCTVCPNMEGARSGQR